MIVAKRVTDTHCEDFVQVDAYLVERHPAHGSSLPGFGGEGPARHLAAEYERNDAECHVLVYAGLSYGIDHESRLLEDFSAKAIIDGLVEFEDASGKFPSANVATLYDQHAALVIEHHSSDAHRMARSTAP